jgi:DNA-binding NtrC family response regulator
VAELDLRDQARLLRTLARGEVRAAGSSEVRRVDVRVVATTRRDLEREVAEGRFREDLYYRLDAARLRVPPLCERPEDVPLLARHFLKRHARPLDLQMAALEWLQEQPWPGNVRELETVVVRSAVACSTDTVTVEGLRDARDGTWPGMPPIHAAREAFERRYVASVLDHSGGSIPSAARIAGMAPSSFRRLVRRCAKATEQTT